jgi:Lon protease-like protein
MASFAMFPLGSVLFPHMPLALRVFEERYLVMMSRVLGDEPAEFGVVLIESGREAAGPEAQRRFRHGTVAEVTELGEADGGMLAVLARGGRRIEVVEWLDDDPHPAAIVRDLPELEWDPALAPLLAQAERVVRRTLARASEFVELPWDADVDVSDDPVASAWQLAGIAPLTALDQVTLLKSQSLRELLMRLIELTHDAATVLTAAWAAEDDLDAELAELRDDLGRTDRADGPDRDGIDPTDPTDDTEENRP